MKKKDVKDLKKVCFISGLVGLLIGVIMAVLVIVDTYPNIDPQSLEGQGALTVIAMSVVLLAEGKLINHKEKDKYKLLFLFIVSTMFVFSAVINLILYGVTYFLDIVGLVDLACVVLNVFILRFLLEDTKVFKK